MIFDYRHCRNEAEVKSKLIVYFLLPKLGYTPDFWYEEAIFRNVRFDFLIVNKSLDNCDLRADLKSSFIVEAKHPRENLDKHLAQFNHYLHHILIEYGILTNGKDFRIYQKVSSLRVDRGLLPNYPRLIFQCDGDSLNKNIAEIKSIIGKNSLQNQRVSKEYTVAQNVIQTNERGEKSMMKVIAIYHNKGGVGKTTTVVNLAAALSKKGKKVLVIDLDSQANTTFATGLVKFESELDDYIENSNVYHVISSSELHPIEEIKATSNFCTPTIDIIPSHINLMEKENKLNQLASINFTLLQKIKDIKDKYDFVLIDTPPSLNLYARIALITAEYLIIPSDLKPFANQGLINVKNFINDINATKKIINQESLKIMGVLPSKITTHAKFVQYTLPGQLSKIRDRYNLPLLDSIIYQREDLARCADLVQNVGELEIPDPRSVLDYRPNSQSAQEFQRLAEEVLNKVEYAVAS